VAAGSALALLILVGLPPALRAAAAERSSPGVLLGKIVGRLSTQDDTSALDCAELGRQTVTWGQDLQTGGKPVPPGPVQDALEAARKGEAIDPKATDWSKLRGELESLLQPPEEQKKPPPQDRQKQPQQQQQNNRQNSPPQSQPDQQRQDQNQGQQPQKQDQSSPSNPSRSGQRPPSSPFDQMRPPAQPPQDGTQQVGGAPDHPRQDPAMADPELVVPMQKLDQLRNQDSPAQLYQMLENNEPRPPVEKKGKQW
jgi:Ca-activated chloride channel family protein